MSLAPDRRRVNGPPSVTKSPEFASIKDTSISTNPQSGHVEESKKIFLKTGIIPSASGSAYLEIQTAQETAQGVKSGIKLACSVHGPRPLPRSAPFSPQLLLTIKVKLTPFATINRRGYVPDSLERDVATHLENALSNVLLSEKWPKSGLDIAVTILEVDDSIFSGSAVSSNHWAWMSLLSGCITVTSTAIQDTGVDCVDVVVGGSAALVMQPDGKSAIVANPRPSADLKIEALCVLAYLHYQDEITGIWFRGECLPRHAADPPANCVDALIEKAIETASMTRLVVIDSLGERLSGVASGVDTMSH